MDSIADMLTRIRNASAVRRPATTILLSRLTLAIAEILAREGWIGEVTKQVKKTKRTFDISLVYKESGEAAISGIRRVSTSKKRIYRGWREIGKVRGGYGLAIVSTPQGLRTDAEARKLKAGGEVLLEVW